MCIIYPLAQIINKGWPPHISQIVFSIWLYSHANIIHKVIYARLVNYLAYYVVYLYKL